jgi:hypothetical protein
MNMMMSETINKIISQTPIGNLSFIMFKLRNEFLRKYGNIILPMKVLLEKSFYPLCFYSRLVQSRTIEPAKAKLLPKAD